LTDAGVKPKLASWKKISADRNAAFFISPQVRERALENARRYDELASAHCFDKETGLSYNYFRDYDSQTGRYVESDPIGLEGGINTFAYTLNNPISNVDPSGQFVWPVWVRGGAAGVGFGIGWGIGTLIYNGLDTQIQDGLEKLFPYPSDPVLQQQIEKEANAREYHRRCNEPPPPGLDPCERAKWMLKKAQECKAMRIENTNRWWGGVDSQHNPQLFRDLDNAIKNAQDAVDRLCNKCK